MCSDERLFLNGAGGLNVSKIRNSESKLEKHFKEISTFNERRKNFLMIYISYCLLESQLNLLIFVLYFSSEMHFKTFRLM
jgi:hypothetical protein